jgi:hypothetical protein
MDQVIQDMLKEKGLDLEDPIVKESLGGFILHKKDDVQKFYDDLTKKAQNNYWILLPIIDPGSANFGNALGRYKVDIATKTIYLQFARHSLKNERVSDHTVLQPQTNFQDFRNWYHKQNWKSDLENGITIVMEQQYVLPPANRADADKWLVTFKLGMIQQTLVTMFGTLGIHLVLIPSASAKKELGICAPKNVPKEKRHNVNKELVVAFAKSLFKTDQEKAMLFDNDHICDCIAYGYYYLKDSHKKAYNEDFKVDVSIVENF